MNILDKIVEKKIVEVNQLKNSESYTSLEKSDYFGIPTKSLSKNILQNQISIIAEHKRKSPSKSDINHLTSTKDIVHGYEYGGAVGISFLTEKNFFDGSVEDFKEARKITKLPLLRKDFIIDEYQIIESKSIGADAILLIAACLNDTDILKLSNLAKSIGLEVLIEIHEIEELKKSSIETVDIIGINNRDLKTFDVNIDISKKLSSKIPDNYLKVSESGIKSIKDIKILKSYGFKGFLIGENFMKSNSPGIELKNFVKNIEE